MPDMVYYFLYLWGNGSFETTNTLTEILKFDGKLLCEFITWLCLMAGLDLVKNFYIDLESQILSEKYLFPLDNI